MHSGQPADAADEVVELLLHGDDPLHEHEVALRVLRDAVESVDDPLEVAGQVAQPVAAGRRDEPGVHQPAQVGPLVVDDVRGQQLGRGQAGLDRLHRP